MKKLLGSLDGKTANARLLESSGGSRGNSLSQGLNYQACSEHGTDAEKRKKNKNGSARSFFGTPGCSTDEVGEKFHLIKDEEEISETKFLCVLGCFGGGKIGLVWMKCKGQMESGVLKREEACLSEAESSTPSRDVVQGTSILEQQTNDICLDDPENTFADHQLGRIQFSIHYDFPEQTLTLRIIKATDLVAKDFSGTSDPYVKIMLLPDKKRKLMTNVKRKTLNPRWNEVFAFEGFPYTKLMNKTLYLQVLDYDRFSRDDPIGEGKLGEIQVGLCYQPSNGRLSVNILKARDLKAKDITGSSDPYVKIWFMLDGKKSEKKKTRIVEKSLNPHFDEAFLFDVPCEKIRQTSLMISVMDYDRMGRNEQIGQILLGSKSGPTEVKHWNEMFSQARQEVFQWHILKDFG